MFKTEEQQIFKIDPAKEKRMSFVDRTRPATSIMVGSGYYEVLKNRVS